jgi:hypothetical protein
VKEQIKRDGRRVFVYEQPRTGDVFTIVDPDLQLNQLEQVQKDVADLLEHGLPPSAVEATQTPSPAPDNTSDEGTDPGSEPETDGSAGSTRESVPSGVEASSAADATESRTPADRQT